MKGKKIIKKLALLINTLAVYTIYTMSSVTAFAEEATGTAATASGEEPSAWGTLISTFLLPILLLVFLYFIMIRPQQKQEKATREMQKNLCVGDEVITIGGIVGIVLKVNENTETIVLETGSDHSRILMKQDAIKENITAIETAEAEKAKSAKNKANPLSVGKPKDE